MQLGNCNLRDKILRKHLVNYELTDSDIELLRIVQKAIDYDQAGHPIKDAIERDEIVAAMQLLLKIVTDNQCNEII